MRTSKNTRLGIIACAGAGVAGLAIAGIALPATADDTTSSLDDSTSTTEVAGSLEDFQAWVTDTISLDGTDSSPVTGVSPDTGVGDISVVEGPLVGDVGSGNQAPIGSGNETPIGSGNDVTAPIGSGNETGNGSANGTEAGNGSGNGTEAGNGNTADTSTGDVGADTSTGDAAADVSNDDTDVTGELDSTVDDVTGALGLGGLLD